jgi:(p)ppGpp synthase/HD superfamily hydrolase
MSKKHKSEIDSDPYALFEEVDQATSAPDAIARLITALEHEYEQHEEFRRNLDRMLAKRLENNNTEADVADLQKKIYYERLDRKQMKMKIEKLIFIQSLLTTTTFATLQASPEAMA